MFVRRCPRCGGDIPTEYQPKQVCKDCWQTITQYRLAKEELRADKKNYLGYE